MEALRRVRNLSKNENANVNANAAENDFSDYVVAENMKKTVVSNNLRKSMSLTSS